MWADYLAQPRDSMDYLYLGSSYVYCDVDPAAVEDASGLRGFAMAGPEQTMGISYWYLRECLRTQSPRAVIIEGTALHFEEFQGYTQVNLAYMPYGLNRIAAAFTVAEPELRTGILFDLYFYHDRWKELYGDLDPRRGRTAPAPAPHGGAAGGRGRAGQPARLYARRGRCRQHGQGPLHPPAQKRAGV